MSGEYIEIKANKRNSCQSIKFFHLESYEDIKSVAKSVRKGNLALVSVKKVREKSMVDFKMVVDKMKKLSVEVGGSISGLDKNWVCVTPYNISINKLIRV